MENWKEISSLKKAGFPYFASSKYDCRKMGKCREIEIFDNCLSEVRKMHHVVSVIRRTVCIKPAQEAGESIWALFDKGIYSKRIPWPCLTQTASRIPVYLKTAPCLGVMEWSYFYRLLLFAQLSFAFMKPWCTALHACNVLCREQSNCSLLVCLLVAASSWALCHWLVTGCLCFGSL